MVVRPYFTEDKHVLPFDKVIELERIDDWTFRSVVKAYSPTGGENGTYSGHVFAQAAWAAAQTVGEGFLIHVCCTGRQTFIAYCEGRTSQAGSC
jgi:acyl-CoA thioesterase